MTLNPNSSPIHPHLMHRLSRVALTGHPGSGKSVIMKWLKMLGFKTILTDDITREIYTTPHIQRIINENLLLRDVDSIITKEVLRGFVEMNPQNLDKLGTIVQPYIYSSLLMEIEAIDKLNQSCVIVEIPLLFEAKWHKIFETTIVVTIDQAKQKEHLMERGLTTKYLDFLQSQFHDQCDYLDQVNYVIDNKMDKKYLWQQVKQLITTVSKNA